MRENRRSPIFGRCRGRGVCALRSAAIESLRCRVYVARILDFLINLRGIILELS